MVRFARVIFEVVLERALRGIRQAQVLGLQVGEECMGGAAEAFRAVKRAIGEPVTCCAPGSSEAFGDPFAVASGGLV